MLIHKGTQPIETKRLLLRPFREEDAAPMFKNWANDPQVCRYTTWNPHGKVEVTQALVKAWVAEYEKPDYYNWVIVLKDGDTPIGSISLVQINRDYDWCEIGYCLSRTCWGQGVMTEAVTALIEYLFNQVGFHRIQAKHHMDNIGSGKVMQKSGMILEGVLKDVMHKEGLGFYDCPQYSIISKG